MGKLQPTNEAQQVLAEMTDRERQAFNDFSEAWRGKHEKDLWFYWERGQELAKLATESKRGGGHYGAKLIERFALVLGVHETTLRTAIRVFQVWPTKSAFSDLVCQSDALGNSLTWGHLVRLGAIDSESRRKLLINKVLTDCLKPDELDRVIQAKRPRTSAGGRSLRIPSSLTGCIGSIQTVLGKVNRLHEKAWFSEKFDLKEQLAEVDNVDETLVQQVSATLDEAVRLNAHLSELVKTLESANKSLEKRCKS